MVAEDRQGLLYALTSAISSAGANIEVVLIDTEAHKAIDVLYVTQEGKKLASDRTAGDAAGGVPGAGENVARCGDSPEPSVGPVPLVRAGSADRAKPRTATGEPTALY